MGKQVSPPGPTTLLVFFTFAVVAGSVFVILPVLLAVMSFVTAAIELKYAAGSVAGDFSGIVLGNYLWRLAVLPFRHWIIASVSVVVITVLFVLFTRAVGKKSVRTHYKE